MSKKRRDMSDSYMPAPVSIGYRTPTAEMMVFDVTDDTPESQNIKRVEGNLSHRALPAIFTGLGLVVEYSTAV